MRLWWKGGSTCGAFEGSPGAILRRAYIRLGLPGLNPSGLGYFARSERRAVFDDGVFGQIPIVVCGHQCWLVGRCPLSNMETLACGADDACGGVVGCNISCFR